MNDKCPETLFHYCSLDTFLKIFETRTIRLCDMRKSNDAMETKWLIKHATKIISSILNENSLDREKVRRERKALQATVDDLSLMLSDAVTKANEFTQFLNTPISGSGTATYKLNKQSFPDLDDLLLMSKMRDPIMACLNQALNEDGYKAWAMCFSCEPDSLSQWRGYADDGAGVMVGFHTQYLEYIQTAILPLKKYCVGLSKVVYPQTVDDFMRILQIEDIKFESKTKRILERCIEALSLARQLPPIYKHPSFADEKEWRIYFMINDPSEVWYDEKGIINNDSYFAGQFKLQKKSFYTRGNQIVSFVPFEIQNMSMAIKSVCIGPKSKVSINDIRNVLVQSGVLKNIDDDSIEITVSKSSYQ